MRWLSEVMVLGRSCTGKRSLLYKLLLSQEQEHRKQGNLYFKYRSVNYQATDCIIQKNCKLTPVTNLSTLITGYN